MDIDISIRNATQDELRQLFKGLLTPVRIGTAANFQSERWSPEEKDAIAGCIDSDEAWENYHEKFPDSPRTQDAVRRMHQNIKVPAPPEEPAPIIKKIPGMAKKESALKNAQAPRWTDPEKEIIKRHVGDKDSAAAWKEYQEKFPGQRNEHAIYLKWYVKHIHPSKYDEWAKAPDRLQLKTEDDKKSKAPQHHQAPHLPFHQKKPEPVYPDERRVEDMNDPTNTPPVGDKVTTGSPQSDPAMSPPAQFDPFVTGIRVTQTGGSKRMFGIGVIKRVNQKEGECLVSFGNGMEWIPKKYLSLFENGKKEGAPA